MKHRTYIYTMTALLLSLCFHAPIFAQDNAIEPTEVSPATEIPADAQLLDASMLHAGSPFSLNIDVSSDDQKSFSEAESSVSARLCPLEHPEDCLDMTLDLPDEDSPTQSGTLSVASLPYPGDYDLTLTYTDNTGNFDQENSVFILQGVQASADVAALPAVTPTPGTKELLYHQASITDSAGNAVCSDTVPCGLLYADDVFTLTYTLPAAWAPSPLAAAADASWLGTPVISWPQDWAAAISAANASGLLAAAENPCIVDEDGQTQLGFTFSPGTERYTSSCQFTLNGKLSGSAENLTIHNENDHYSLADLVVSLPATVVRREVSLIPSLSLKITYDSAPVEQINAGSVSKLYRTLGAVANAQANTTDIALYTLGATVTGIPASRSPQPGDAILVTWDLLNKLNEMNDLPACFTPHSAGVYELGSLRQNEDGSWGSSCELRFPSSLNEFTGSGAINLQFQSSAYSTTGSIGLPALPFSKEKLDIELSVPSRMRLMTNYSLNAQLSGPDGSLSEYARAILNAVGGGTLSSSWDYNGLTDCLGIYTFDANNSAACNVRFETPNGADSLLSYSFNAPGTEALLDISYQPAAEFTIPAVSMTQATLTTELMHAGTPEPLPAALDASYTVLDSYQLKFRLVPDAGFEDVAESVTLDSEGYVTNWDHPLLLQWAMLPGGLTRLNFIKDGNAFEARYDFHFDQGDLDLSGALSQLYTSINIPGWEIHLAPAEQPLQLPTSVNKQTLRMYFGDIYRADGQPQAAVLTGEEMRVDLHIEGNMDSFVPALLTISSQQDGYDNQLVCEAVYEESKMTCRLLPQCSDIGETDYPAVCSSDIELHASYAGDAINSAAEAEVRPYHVERSKVVFEIPQSGNLDKTFMTSVEAASEDMTYMDYGSVAAGSWNIDSYLVRETRDSNGRQYKSYPVNFTWDIDGAAVEPRSENFVLDVTVETGDGEERAEETFSIRPQSVRSGELNFALDFDSSEILDDGRTARDVLAKAMTIKELRAHYLGDPAIAQSSRVYEMQELTFALKVVTEIQTELDTSAEGVMRFGGILGAEAVMKPFTVYCSQLTMPLHCYAEDPLTYAPDLSAYTDTDGNGFDDISGAVLPQSSLPQEGCWGKVTLPAVQDPAVYVSGISAPKSYLTAIDDGAIMLGTNRQ